MAKSKINIVRFVKKMPILTQAALAAAFLLPASVLATGPATSPPTKQVAPTPATQTAVSSLPDIKLIDQLLKQQYKVAAQPPSSSNPFPRLVPRSSNAKTLDFIDTKYQVYDIRPFDDKGFFRRQKLFLIAVDDIFLEARIKLGHRSSGLFALDGKKLTYLNGTDSSAALTKVLRRENRSLSDADPDMLAILFAMTIFRQNNDRIEVVQTAQDVLKLDRPNAAVVNKKMKEKGFERLYSTTVDKPELAKCKGRIIKPCISAQSAGGWKCSFTGFRGFMHTIRVPFALVNYEIMVSRQFDIKPRETVLSSKIIY
jgi:hypothetical protein